MTRRNESVLKQIADLENRSYDELVQIWRTLYGKDPTASNRPYIIKRLAYRIQELHFGGLSERAHKMMDQILDVNGFDENGGKSNARGKEQRRKSGIPVVGTKIRREWRGKAYEVTVIYGGFEYEGRRYNSLTAIAQTITGTHWNGRDFFGLKPTHQKRKKAA